MSDGWYVSRGGEVFGPYTWDRVLEHAHAGLITPDDLVMRPGSDAWVRANEVPALFPVEAPAAPVPTAPLVTPAVPAAPLEVSSAAPAGRRKGATKLVIALACVIGLCVVLFLAPGLFAPKTGTAGSGSVIDAATAWWAALMPGGSGVTDLRGTWTSTTPGNGLVLDATSSGDGAVEAGVPLHIETDYEFVIDRVEGSTAYGKSRMLNTRAFVEDRSSLLADSDFEPFDLDLGEDGTFTNASESSSIRMQGTIEGDRMRGTFELTTSTDGIMTMKGTFDLTRQR